MKKIILLWTLVLVSSFLVWLPFLGQQNLETVFANYDGPNYLVVAKCWYQKDCIGQNFSLPLPLEYYPAHFPGYPALIAVFDQFLPGWWAMLLANILATGLMATGLMVLLKSLKIKNAFFLACLVLFLPARNLIVHTVGAPESLFIATCLGSIYYFRKEQYLLSGLALALAQVTKTPAILLFLAFGLSILLKDKLDFKSWLKKWPLLLGPLAILPVFAFFYYQTGDFWAYFHSGDNFHLFFPPFQSFISSRSWLGDFWLEDIIYVYLIGGIAVVTLLKKYRNDVIALFPAIFYITTLLVAHRDISRYSAPLYPFWIIAFAPYLAKKEFKLVFLILLPAIYLYAINFISYNLAPIADWTPYR
ncbi:MAG: hypothetical protein ABID04_03155 [Patescibacteria group bacterium]